ncbi:MAG: hypothetical protein JSU01_09565 [Bacteroidetes bacterium]|nr:hypothetical protein [Bacteroidota bacterium]
MTDHYIEHNAEKKTFLKKGLIVMVAIATISTVFMTRYALSGSRKGISDNAPDYDDAYLMAKTFIRPTIKSADIVFPVSGYQCAQKPDSVFIVKSYAEKKGKQDPKNITSFEITLKFTGGKVDDKHNWKVINVIED